MMRRLNPVLLASLQLCRARQPGFSIHDDMLAYPQFEIVFSDTVILEKDAQRLIDSSRSAQTTYTAGFSTQTDLTSEIRESASADAGQDGDAEDGMPEISEDFEIINVPPSRYLCSVPVLAPPPAPNQTATDLAKAEEARELARANTRGWELMSGLENQCLYFVSGWWSYKFCYGKEIVQFHSLPTNLKGGLPVRDPHSQEYILGRVQQPQNNKKSRKQNKDLQADQNGQQAGFQPPPNTELQVKGDQRYLVQRMGSGTLCDLTDRDRTIEVQYHCNPGSTVDRIGWIKEITTCSYLMLVHTPRLCEDVAFLPSKGTHAHPINCRRIFTTEDEANAWRLRKSIEGAEITGALPGYQEAEAEDEDAAQTQQDGQGINEFSGMEIGGVIIGGKQLHGTEDGQSPPKLKPPRGFVSGKGPSAGPLIETLAKALSKAEGGQVEVMNDEGLEQRNLDPDTIDQFRKELEKIAGDKGWTLEVVEVPGEVPEIRGIVEDNGEGSDEGEGEGGGGEDGQGSEETFFKEEL